MVSERIRRIAMLAIPVVLCASTVHAQSACDAATRYKAGGKYVACHQKALLKRFDDVLDQVKLSKCRDKLRASWPRVQRDAAQQNTMLMTCFDTRFVDNGDGTVTDNLTALQWEQKTDDASVHDKDNRYTWSAGDGDYLTNDPGDGTAYTDFLATLNGANGGGCFAGQCDWRLPTAAELETIVLEPYPCVTSPCIDPAFGPTTAGLYWSSTTIAPFPGLARGVTFDDGALGGSAKSHVYTFYTRAVRGGL